MWLPIHGVRDQENGPSSGRQPVISLATLRAVQDLNRTFLRLVAAEDTSLHEIPERRLGFAREVVGLSAAGCAVAAQCCFTLFDLRFSDARLWRSIAGEAQAHHLPVPAPMRAFCRSATVLTWHLVRSTDVAVPLVLGMPTDVVEVWRGFPVTALDAVADAAGQFAAPRWPQHSRFWSALVESAISGNLQQLTAVRMLGLQLLAADSLPGQRSSMAARQR